MIKKINILSKCSLDEAINAFDELADFLSGPELIKELTSEAYELVKTNVSNYAPNRISNIFEEVNGNTGKVYTNDKVLIYNEYGTGVIGKQNPHPDLDGWKYDINSHGEGGWTYYDDGFHWTKGLPARMGFYDTRKKLKSIVGDKVKVAIEKNFKQNSK